MPFNGDFYTQAEGKAPSHDFYSQNLRNKGTLEGSWQMRQAYAQGGAQSSGEMRGNINPIQGVNAAGSNPANPGFSSTYARDINTSLGSNSRVGYEASGATRTTGVPNSGPSYNSRRVQGSGSNEEFTIRKFFGGPGKKKKDKTEKSKAAAGPGSPPGITESSGGDMRQSGNKAGGNNIIGNDMSGGNNIVGNDMSGNMGAQGNINSGSGTQNNLGAFARQSSLNLSFGPNSPFNNPAGAPPAGNPPAAGGGAPPAGAPPAAKKARAPRAPKAKPGTPAAKQPAPRNVDVYTATAEKGIADAKARGAGNGVPGAGFVPPVTPGMAQPTTQLQTATQNQNPGNIGVGNTPVASQPQAPQPPATTGLPQVQGQALDMPTRMMGVNGDNTNPSGAPIQRAAATGAYGGRGPSGRIAKPGALPSNDAWQGKMNGYNAYAMQQSQNMGFDPSQMAPMGPQPGRHDMNPLTGAVRPDFGNPSYQGPSRHPQAPTPDFTQGQTGYAGVGMQGIGQADMEMKRQAFRQRSRRPGT